MDFGVFPTIAFSRHIDFGVFTTLEFLGQFTTGTLHDTSLYKAGPFLGLGLSLGASLKNNKNLGRSGVRTWDLSIPGSHSTDCATGHYQGDGEMLLINYAHCYFAFTWPYTRRWLADSVTSLCLRTARRSLIGWRYNSSVKCNLWLNTTVYSTLIGWRCNITVPPHCSVLADWLTV